MWPAARGAGRTRSRPYAQGRAQSWSYAELVVRAGGRGRGGRAPPPPPPPPPSSVRSAVPP
ncbi:hypothetical protein AAHZ94_26135 [Streptomyces sp. HSW2009]|uniref:hypothetical protein n=1 Tax=Streptomyces sp. HSW2009 TaxID=3142890 RepID=UPI0032EB1A8D